MQFYRWAEYCKCPFWIFCEIFMSRHMCFAKGCMPDTYTHTKCELWAVQHMWYVLFYMRTQFLLKMIALKTEGMLSLAPQCLVVFFFSLHPFVLATFWIFHRNFNNDALWAYITAQSDNGHIWTRSMQTFY